jgi:hypothetical protein
MQKPMVLAMLLATAACFPAAAQSPAPQAMRPGMRPDRAAMMKARADDIALLIGLRPEQRAGLDALLEHRMPPPGGPERGPMARAPEGPPPSFEARLAEMEKHDAAEHTRIAAIKAFYQGLDAQQRARFEAVMRLRGGPGHGFGPPGFGPGGFGHPPMMGGMHRRGMPGGPEGEAPPR